MLGGDGDGQALTFVQVRGLGRESQSGDGPVAGAAEYYLADAAKVNLPLDGGRKAIGAQGRRHASQSERLGTGWRP